MTQGTLQLRSQYSKEQSAFTRHHSALLKASSATFVRLSGNTRNGNNGCVHVLLEHLVLQLTTNELKV